jgi:hypothetical protein
MYSLTSEDMVPLATTKSKGCVKKFKTLQSDQTFSLSSATGT